MCGDGVRTIGGCGEVHRGLAGRVSSCGYSMGIDPRRGNYNQLSQLKHLKIQIHYDLATNSDVKWRKLS